MTVFRDGSNFVDFTYVKNVTWCHVLAAEQLNVANSGQVTFKHFPDFRCEWIGLQCHQRWTNSILGICRWTAAKVWIPSTTCQTSIHIDLCFGLVIAWSCRISELFQFIERRKTMDSLPHSVQSSIGWNSSLLFESEGPESIWISALGDCPRRHWFNIENQAREEGRIVIIWIKSKVGRTWTTRSMNNTSTYSTINLTAT